MWEQVRILLDSKQCCLLEQARTRRAMAAVPWGACTCATAGVQVALLETAADAGGICSCRADMDGAKDSKMLLSLKIDLQAWKVQRRTTSSGTCLA
jgi:hypothetical protein